MKVVISGLDKQTAEYFRVWFGINGCAYFNDFLRDISTSKSFVEVLPYNIKKPKSGIRIDVVEK